MDRLKKENEKLLFPILDLIMISSIWMVVLNVIRRVLFFRFQRLRRKFQKREKRFGKAAWAKMIGQNLCLLVMPLRSLVGHQLNRQNDQIESQIFYYGNDFLNLFQLYKLYPVIRSYITSSFFSSNRSYRVW